ncbi:MAG: hypothetical protein AB7N76_12845 [Planctomycetota bacterium]
MTAIFYGDFDAVSDDGTRRLEARSPDNEAEGGHSRWGGFQRNFTYTLFDSASERPLWSRPQPKGEDTPHEAFVSGSGWVVLRTHGPLSAGLLVLSPTGEEVLRIDVLTEVFEGWEASAASGEVSYTTAGPFWSRAALAGFLEVQGRSHFFLRTWKGRRIVVDLSGGRLVSPDDALDAALVPAVEAKVRSALGRQCPVPLDALGDDWWRNHAVSEWVESTISAANAAGQLRVEAVVPQLKELERVPLMSGYESTGPLNEGGGGGWWLHCRGLRLVVQHALRRLGQRPDPQAVGYEFRRHAGALQEPGEFPRPSDRRQAAQAIKGVAKAAKVLARLGVPDFIGRSPDAELGEAWEYDLEGEQGFETLRVTFARRGRVARIEDLVPPPWLEDSYREQRWLA